MKLVKISTCLMCKSPVLIVVFGITSSLVVWVCPTEVRWHILKKTNKQIKTKNETKQTNKTKKKKNQKQTNQNKEKQSKTKQKHKKTKKQTNKNTNKQTNKQTKTKTAQNMKTKWVNKLGKQQHGNKIFWLYLKLKLSLCVLKILYTY